MCCHALGACYMHATRGAAILLPLPTLPIGPLRVHKKVLGHMQHCMHAYRAAQNGLEACVSMLMATLHYCMCVHMRIYLHTMMLMDIQHYLKVLLCNLASDLLYPDIAKVGVATD